jgi:glycine hydroxymethyltransferase
MKVEEAKQFIINKVKESGEWRGKCLNMIASENVTSQLLDSVYISDFYHRYAEGDPFSRYYQGTKIFDEIEKMVKDLAKEMLKAKEVDVRLISGTVANIAAISMLSKPGDSIISSTIPNGGHLSHNVMGAAGLLQNRINPFPTTEDGYHIDVDKTKKLIKNINESAFTHLSMVILGGSLFLFPHPVKELSELGKEEEFKVLYDAAHVLGLIVGGEFQQPLQEGADLMSSSTHKTFFGPQGGLIAFSEKLSNEEIVMFRKNVFPGVSSNHHLHRIPALGIALLEFKKHGKDYAKQTIKNAKTLAQSLNENGFDVEAEEFGFTESHQVAVDVSKIGGGKLSAQKLEENNIIVNKNSLPKENLKGDSDNPCGLRIGVQELTRRGLKETDMKEVAGFFKEALIDKKNVKNRVSDFTKQFKIQYTI